MRDCQTLLDEYGGKLSRLHQVARNSRDLEQRLDSFYGVGPITTNIFLRELRPFWRKADPAPLPVVLATARRARVPLQRLNRKTIAFVRLEAGLIHLAHRHWRQRGMAEGGRRAP